MGHVDVDLSNDDDRSVPVQFRVHASRLTGTKGDESLVRDASMPLLGTFYSVGEHLLHGQEISRPGKERRNRCVTHG